MNGASSLTGQEVITVLPPLGPPVSITLNQIAALVAEQVAINLPAIVAETIASITSSGGSGLDLSAATVTTGTPAVPRSLAATIAGLLPLSGGAMLGRLQVQLPIFPTDAVSKGYVDNAVAYAGIGAGSGTGPGTGTATTIATLTALFAGTRLPLADSLAPADPLSRNAWWLNAGLVSVSVSGTPGSSTIPVSADPVLAALVRGTGLGLADLLPASDPLVRNAWWLNAGIIAISMAGAAGSAAASGSVGTTLTAMIGGTGLALADVLPVADPHVRNMWWLNSGLLAVSSGP